VLHAAAPGQGPTRGSGAFVVKIGPDYRVSHTLPGGEVVTLRPIQPDDRGALHDAFMRLSPESRYRRFFAPITDLTDEKLTYLCCVDGIDHFALVATTVTPDLKSELGVGVARFVRSSRDPGAAEAAVTVVDDMQHRGIGKLLMLTLVEAALERGIRRLTGEVLATNEPVLEALRASGAKLESLEEGTVRFEVPLGAGKEPLLLHLLREAARSIPGFLLRLYPASSRHEG